MTEEDRRLLREVHAMLTKLLSREYEEQQDIKQFCINYLLMHTLKTWKMY